MINMWICFSYHYLPLTRLSYLFHSKLRNSLYIYYYIIVTDMKGNIRRDRLFKNRGNDIARAGDFMDHTLTQGQCVYPGISRAENVMVHSMIQEQSVYPGIALHSSKYTFYCYEDQSLTHTIQMHIIVSRNQET